MCKDDQKYKKKKTVENQLTQTEKLIN